MDRVIVTNPFVGICHMQVCAENDATPEEILAVANRENPSGTFHGWGGIADGEGQAPVPCVEHPGRIHYLLYC